MSHVAIQGERVEVISANRTTMGLRWVFPVCVGLAGMVFVGANDQLAAEDGDRISPPPTALELTESLPLTEVLSPTEHDIVFGLYRVRVRCGELPDGWRARLLYEPVLGISRTVSLSVCNREDISVAGKIYSCDLPFSGSLDSKVVEIQILDLAGDVVHKHRVCTQNHAEGIRIEEIGAREVQIKLAFNDDKVKAVLADPSRLVATLGGSIGERATPGGGSELDVTGLELEVIEIERLEPPAEVIVVLILDASQSIGNPFRLRDIFDQFVEKLKKSEASGAIVRGHVIRFSDTAQSVTHGTTSDLTAVKDAMVLGSLEAGTNVWAGIRLGVNAALAAKANSTHSARVEAVILLVTDAVNTAGLGGSASEFLGPLTDAGIVLNIVRIPSTAPDGAILGLAKESGGQIFSEKDLLDVLPVALLEDTAGKYGLKVAPKNGDWDEFRDGVRQGKVFRVSVLDRDGNLARVYRLRRKTRAQRAGINRAEVANTAS